MHGFAGTYQHQLTVNPSFQSVGMSMLQMSRIAGKALTNLLQFHLAVTVFLCKRLHAAFEATFVAGAQTANHLAGFCQVKMPAHIIHALRQREQLCLFVKGQLQFLRSNLRDLVKALFVMTVSSDCVLTATSIPACVRLIAEQFSKVDYTI